MPLDLYPALVALVAVIVSHELLRLKPQLLRLHTLSVLVYTLVHYLCLDLVFLMYDFSNDIEIICEDVC